MGLDLWFREDVVRILASTQETMRSSIAASRPLDVAVADSYRDGFDDALRSVAVAFGICVPSVLARQSRGPAHAPKADAGRLPPTCGFSVQAWPEQGRGQGEP